MTEAHHLSDALVGFLSDPESGWFTPVTEAIQGLTAEQAARIPSEGFNSVWGVVRHMSYWQEFLLHRFRGETVEQMKIEGKENWQAINQPYDERAWQADCEHLFTINKDLAEVVAGFSDEALDEPYSEGRAKRYQVIQGIIAHNCYHTNEIISIRHMLGYWLERT